MSTDPLPYLVQLRDWFARWVGQIYREAWAIEEPAGSSAAWQQICGTYGVPLVSDVERQQVRSAQQPLRGAPVMEVHQVVGAVVSQARNSLVQVATDGISPQAAALHDQLGHLFERTERELIEAYKRAVLPQRRGMFGNVLAHQSSSPSEVAEAHAHAFLCSNCGAPRLDDKDFTCAFCGEHMAG